ncbi:MAG TPA: phosphoribosylamine--glycine ligase [Calditerricola sp.]
MKVLVVGQGGREHALCWALARSPRVARVYCAPGNGGIAEVATCVPIKETDFAALAQFARDEGIGLTVVGPEAPLAAGIVDFFRAQGLPIFGPTRAAAQVESSKAFAKRIMKASGIPTADYAVFDDVEAALAYVREKGAPIVVKADGLAAGKGVTVARTVAEAEAALHRAMREGVFGAAGSRVVIEEYLEGEELSLMAFVDGETVRPMVPAQDHKPVFDGDRGPNTGGMGAYSPVPQIGPAVIDAAVERILKPMAAALVREGCPFTGVLYAGLMVTADGPKVIEFNARFGDPETQVVLPRLKTDLLEVLLAVVEGRLAEVELAWRDEAALCVVLASGGYPHGYETGKAIAGLDRIDSDVLVFHAGTRRTGEALVTSGGRVLGVTALGATLAEAQRKAYANVARIRFDGMHFRTDIGNRALRAAR